jgi:hypothetical protein
MVWPAFGVLLALVVPLFFANGNNDSAWAEESSVPPIVTHAPPDWRVEHVAFALGNSGKVVGGPARWAICGGLPRVVFTAEAAAQTGSGGARRLYYSDQRRHVWLLEDGEVWPIAGCDDLGEQDGPATVASFIYSGAYGGNHSGMTASGHAVYMLDAGRLRRIQRQADGSWSVQTVAGQGKAGSKLAPGQRCKLSELSSLGKGLTVDIQGNLYFTLDGGLLRADRNGDVSWVITSQQATDDLKTVYAKKWPGVAPPAVALGVGETVELRWHPSGEIYGMGRTWPQAWKITTDGRFVPLVGYAPKDRLFAVRWGEGDPALYEVHCPMGCGVSAEGWPIFQNEIPWATTRYEPNRVSVLRKDGSWGLLPPGSPDFFRFVNIKDPVFHPDGSLWAITPEPFCSASISVCFRLKSLP